MNQDSRNNPPSGKKTDENMLHQALNALEILLGVSKPENSLWNRAKASEEPFSQDGYHSLLEDENLMSLNTNNEAFQALVKQLTDEIEVIVQSRVEEAVRNLTKDITHQVKNHLDIMLPTLLEDMTNLMSGRDK